MAVAGRPYAPPAPKTYGTGTFPYKPKDLRHSLMQGQDIRLDVPEQRFALDLDQRKVAERVGVSLGRSVQRTETGEWVDAHVLLRVCSNLGLEIWQRDEVRRTNPPAARRRKPPTDGPQE